MLTNWGIGSMNIQEFDFLKPIDSLSKEQIIAYLFSSTLPYSAKKIICDEVNALDFFDSRLNKIKELFIDNGDFDESLLTKDYCPNVIKKVILSEIYGNNLLNVILNSDVSLERKKLIIDLNLSVKEAIDLLKKDISLEIRNYVISSRFKVNSSIVELLKDDNVSDEIKEKIVIRNININNIFNILSEETPFSVRSLILRYKRRDIDDYFNSLTSDNILNVIVKEGVRKSFFEDLLRDKYSIIVKAISKADTNTLRKVIRLCDDERLNNIILFENETGFLEVIRTLEPVLLLSWLNLRNLSDEAKDYLITCHKAELDKILDSNFIQNPKRFLRTYSNLPSEIEKRVFESCKERLIYEFKNMSNSEIIDSIILGEYGDLLLNLIIDVSVNESNIFNLLTENKITDRIIDRLFERKSVAGRL